jgi:hypothetical protein
VYRSIELTKTILDNHIKDMSFFRFSYFWSLCTTFLSPEDVRYFLFGARSAPDSILIYEVKTKAIAGLLLIYPPRKEYEDLNVVLLLSRTAKIDIESFAEEVKKTVYARMKKGKLFCMRSNVLETEKDQIEVLEKIGFEREIVMREHVYYGLKYMDAYAYTLFRSKLC